MHESRLRRLPDLSFTLHCIGCGRCRLRGFDSAALASEAARNAGASLDNAAGRMLADAWIKTTVLTPSERLGPCACDCVVPTTS